MDELPSHPDWLSPLPESVHSDVEPAAVQIESIEPTVPGFDLKLYFVLLAASLLGTLAILPYSRTLMVQMAMPIPPGFMPVVWAVTIVAELMISAVSIALGLGLGPRLGMARMFNERSSPSEPSLARRLWRYVGLPLGVGALLGVVILLSTSNVELGIDANKVIKMPPPWEGFLASIGAGVREEIWLRLGLLTFLVWLATKLQKKSTALEPRVGAKTFWIANVLAALCFAAIHLPQAQMLLGLTPGLIVFVFMGNGVPGIAFGWLYWQRGLVAAMVAHFGLDLVLKVAVPLFS